MLTNHVAISFPIWFKSLFLTSNMRIHGYLKNKSHNQLKKENRKKKNSGGKRRTQKKLAAKKARLASVDYLEFMSDEQIKKLESAKCTKLLTGKRQRKIMKRLRHEAREKNNEVKFDEKFSDASKEPADVEMKEI